MTTTPETPGPGTSTSGTSPLSPAQHGMWVTEQVLRPGSAHHLAVTVRFDGPPDAEALAAACARVSARHPVLTARLDPEGPWLAAGTGVAAALRRLDCAPDGLDALLRDETVRPFDLGSGPLVRFALVAAGPDRHVLHVVAHHLVFDGMSKDILLSELSGVAKAVDDSGHSEEATGDTAAAAGFWASRWHDPAAPTLPGLPVSVRGTTAPAPGASVPFTLDARQHERLGSAARALGVTRFELLLAAWHTLLLRYGNRSPATALELSTRRPEDAGRIGLYVNELPVFTQPDPARPFAEFAQEVRTELRALYAHRAVPLGRAVRGLTPRTALTPLSVSYRRRTEPGAGPLAAEATTADLIGFTHAVRNLAHLQLVDSPDRLDGSLQYRADAFAPGAPERILGHFRTLLDAVLTDPGTVLADLPLLAGDELDRALRAGATTPAACPPDATAVSMFAARAAATPDAVAVVGEDGQELPYGQLHAAAAAFADRIRALGLGAGDLIGIQLPRSVNQLVAVLGVLMAGAAHVPLDPDYPAERLAFVRADAGLAALVIDGAAPEGLPAGLPVLAPGRAGGPEPVRPLPGPSPEDPAYVIYTSGSTGTPKGVEVPHSALANLLATMTERLGAGAGDRWLGLTSLSFDISAVELLLPLTVGAGVVLVPESQQRDGAALLKLIDARGITHVQATPSSWRLMLAAGLHRPGLVAVAGGEALPGPLAEELAAASGRLINVYGPTETTVWSTLADLAPGDPVTIGGPLAATRALVRDEHGQPAVDGIAGELHLGGAGVAHGYRGRPGLTAQRFVPDPYGPPGSRLYRTGDLVRRLPDGQLEFAGRTDTQVKLRGHRIELGEIEARLCEHPRVAEAAVVLKDDENGDAGQARLAAYVVPDHADHADSGPSPDVLRAHLARTLPAPMVPGAWVTLDAFPLTPNGKLDRAALPEPPRTRADAAPVPGTGTGTDTPPGTHTTAAVVRDIWQQVLRLDDIGPDEDLFDLGGHSLTITAIAARIRKQLGVEVPLDVFFDTPTITGVCAAVIELQQQEEDR
ncbi:non-ribosomal peptide synthetase [Streptomyces sp. NBC_01217]|uniref:non-ribosomal peptide synthetase n=1 Tax=Streptomyces sp. NBC_01217 TaxID=2903779 RepID=UPI002E0E0F69|nr:amino acid adenylation domain-containing protein [Streptomyces sp. NBC_01217]